MDKLEPFFDRRSIRRYTDQRIDNKTIEKILKAAMYAPSAVNQQPWHFVVLESREMLGKIMEIHPHAGMLQTASHAIYCVHDLSNSNHFDDTNSYGLHFRGLRLGCL